MIRRPTKPDRLNSLLKWLPAEVGTADMAPTLITPRTEVWIRFGDAIKSLMARRRIELEAALPILREACLFYKVAWRHIVLKLDERGRLLTGQIAPDMLTFWSETRRKTIHPLEEQIEIRESDLSRWPVKPRRGPERGTITRFADEPT
jgi:hypothetical protein